MQEIEIPVWVKRGNMLIRRDALDGHDPDHPYNYIRNKYHVDPELYGIEKPKMYENCCPACGFRW